MAESVTKVLSGIRFMSNTANDPVLNYIRKLGGEPGEKGVADRELIRRFVTEQDEAAFELLLWRYAAMVRHVCRGVTRDLHDAEDAFQATFLVLARKAWSVRKQESLGAWLYRVAYRIALQTRSQMLRRAAHEARGGDLRDLPQQAPLQGAQTVDEWRPLLLEEVNRLPAKYRTPIILCYLEGKTLADAAHQLGWPRGTVSGRLARARDMLRSRLLLRGLPLTAVALIEALSPGDALAMAPLLRRTLQSAVLFACGKATTAATLSGPSALLAEGMLRTMFMTKLKLTVAIVLASLLFGTGAGLFASGMLGAMQESIAPLDPGWTQSTQAPAAAPDAKGTKDKEVAPTAEEQFKALVKEFDEGSQHVSRRDKYEVQVLELAQKHPKEPFAVDALLWILKRGWQRNGGILLATSQPFGKSASKAFELLARNYAEDKRVGVMVQFLLSLAPPAAEEFLLAVMKKNPDRTIQAGACLGLATRFQWLASLARFNADLTRRGDTNVPQKQRDRLIAKYEEEEKAQYRKAERYFKLTIEKYGDVRCADKRTMGEHARAGLVEVRKLAGGKAAPDEKDKVAQKELKKLAGTWEVLSVESNGRKDRKDDIKGLAYVFEANGKWKLKKDEDIRAEGTFKIDTTKKPATIDYKIVSSIDKGSIGKTSLGIFKLDGDKLTVCRTWPDNDDRPTEFTAGADSKCILTEFKRKKE
jgi:RNA polymerase sigma factor (sigma-70 family)